MKLLGIFIFSLITIKSCGSQITNNTSSKKPSGTYTITSLAENKTLPENLTIAFDTVTNGISGFSGCNHFFGSYTLENNTIMFSKIGATTMLCEEKSNQIEMALLQSLEKITSFSFENNILNLYAGKHILIQAKKEAPTKHLVSLKYTASARGSYLNIIANKTTISKSKKRGGNPISKTCKDSDWNRVLELIKEVDIEALPKLEVPSKDYQFDGAPMSRLKVIYEGESYETLPFDHGNPPKDIAELVKELLSISENIE